MNGNVNVFKFHLDLVSCFGFARCNLVPVVTEIDRIVRPGGNLIVRDESSVIGEVEALLKSLHWEITSTNLEGLLCGKKGMWRPSS